MSSDTATPTDHTILAQIKHYIDQHQGEQLPVAAFVEEVLQWGIAPLQETERLIPIDQYEEDCYNGVAARQRVRNRLARKRIQSGVELYVGIAVTSSSRIGIVTYHPQEGKLEYGAYGFWPATARLEKLKSAFDKSEVLIYATCGGQEQHQYTRDIELLVELCKGWGYSCTMTPLMAKQWSDAEFRLHTKVKGRKVPQCVRDAARIIWWRWL